MNWYKYAKDFHDRNTINHKILYLENIRNTLGRISKVVFQSGTVAKQSNLKILTSKKISSYPILKDILVEADAIVLDSPWRFAELCEEAIYSVDNKIYKLKRERDDINDTGKKKYPKGWV